MTALGDYRVGTALPPIHSPHRHRCYEIATDFAMKHFLAGNRDWSVVHGTIQGSGRPALDHAWAIDIDSDAVYEPGTHQVYPLDAFVAVFNPTWDAVYGSREWMLATTEYGHYGPWDGSVPPSDGPEFDEDDDQ